MLTILLVCLLPPRILFSEEISSDPIKNSYIIDNLQMESDRTFTGSEQEPAEGGIIFDNSFDDGLTKTIIKPGDQKEILKKLPGSDKRLHLVEYRIKHNESLWSIAKKSNITINKLIEINDIKNPKFLKENDILLIPSTKGVFYKIRKGDTLTEISQKYKVEIDIIAEHNNIDGRKIIAGKKIFLPDAVEPVKENKINNKIESKIETSVAIKKNNHRKNENNESITATEKVKEKLSAGRVVLSWPLRGPITSGFGIRTHPFSGDKKFHCGLDIGAEVGTVVRAAGEGTVIFSGWKDAYGNMIVISHKNNYLTIYAHNSRILVGLNEKIKKGQKIALSGKTGAVTGAHLHFEIRKGIVPLNPLRILK